MTVYIKRLSETAKMPIRGSREAAGWDMYADLGEGSCTIVKPGERVLIGTGVAMEIPEGWFGQLHSRSGLATKRGLRLTTGVSVIDADYRGEIVVALYNDSHVERLVSTGDRIAQIVFQRYPETRFIEVDELHESERGMGGFGSSGVR